MFYRHILNKATLVAVIATVGIVILGMSQSAIATQSDNNGYCEMQLTKQVDSSTASPGQELNYTITLTNTGTGYCTGGGVKLKDIFSDLVTPIDNSATPEAKKKKNGYWEWNFGEVEPGSVKQVTLAAQIDSDAACGSVVVNKACAWSKEYKKYGIKDPDLGKGWICTTVETTVECNNPAPQCGNGVLEAGEQCDDGNLVSGDGCNASCEIEKVPMCPVSTDILLVIDRSASMADDSYCQENPALDKAQCEANGFTWKVEPMDSVKTAAKYFVDILDDNKDQVGVVSFATTASLDQNLTSNFTAVKTAIDSMTPYGWTNIGQGLDLAREELDNNRRNEAFPVIILLTDGIPNVDENGNVNDENGGFAYALSAAQAAKDSGYTIFTIGLGSSTNPDLLKQLASSPDNYFSAPSVADLSKIYNQIAFDICEYGSIGGCKYNDLNNNSSIDAGEPTVDGWPIEISGGNLPSPLTVETVNGCYQFFGLEAGTYTVKEKDGGKLYEQTYPVSPSEYTVNLNWGEEITNLDFANYFPVCGNGQLDDSYGEQCDDGNLTDGDGCSSTCQLELGVIAGCKYNDANNNGIIDQDESTLSGWKIVLTKPDGTEVETNTGQNGCYEFTNLEPGQYNVRELQISGWSQTYPDFGSYDIDLSYGQKSLNNDFANYQEEPAPYCGDGIKNGNEECDGTDGVGDGQSCSLECTLVEEPPVCSGDCGGGGGGPVKPVLSITKTPNKTLVNPGEIVDYTITISNQGNGTGYDLTLIDTLPDNYLTYYSTSTFSTSTTKEWSLGDIKVGETKTVKYQVLFSTTTPSGKYTNTAVASVSNGDSVETQATVEVRLPQVLGEEYESLLSLIKAANMSFTNPGNTVTYSLVVTNTSSDETAVNVTLVDRLPKGFTFIDNQTDVNSWVIGDLAPGESKKVEYEVLVGEEVTAGEYENLAVARADNAPEVFAKASVEVRDISVLGFELPDTNGGEKALGALLAGIMLVIGALFISRRQKIEDII